MSFKLTLLLCQTLSLWRLQDCLFLNVYAPVTGLQPTRTLPSQPSKENMSFHSAHRLYPVLVYFPAGQFMWGSGNDAENFDAPNPVNDTVVVTANYRLGALGCSEPHIV